MMQNFNKLEATKFVAFLILIILFLFTYFKNPETIPFSDSYWQKEIDRINHRYDDLQSKYDSIQNVTINRLQKIDTIEKTKKEIEYVYIEKNNQIDTFGISSILNSFQRILAKSNSK
jgi:translation initiation factor 2B subunit (eIF-2B alpha/beta/delta family)